QFVDNRDIVRGRLTQLNERNVTPTSFYTNKSQDVLISSFIAAYTGQDASSVNLSPFPRIPIPNWRIDYAGLSKVGFLKEYFNTININHSYTSEYRVANYTSSLRYQLPEQTSIDVDETNYQIPSEANEVDSTFIPVYVIGQVIISERMAPVIGVNLRTKSNLNIKLDYNRSRDLSLNLSNAQVTEVRSNDIVIGLGFTKKNLRLPFKDSDRKNVVLKNNVDFRVDFSIRDTKTFQRSAEQEDVVTGGNRNFQLKPNVSYNVDQRLTMQAYLERSINTPAISNSFPRRNTTVGFQVRYNLTE
ncbi:MAG: cell surface protein SprA, partial [Bacteroidota bacterium]